VTSAVVGPTRDRLAAFVAARDDAGVDGPAATRARLILALELADAGIALMRARLRREHPDESEAQITERLRRWLDDRPLDTPGRVRRFGGEAR